MHMNNAALPIESVDIESRFRALMQREFPNLHLLNFGNEFQALLHKYFGSGEIAGLRPYDATELVGQFQAATASIKAHEVQAVVACVGPEAIGATTVRKGSDVSLEDIRSTELGAYLGISPLAARNLAEHCRALVRWLPVTLSSMSVGNCDDGKARIISDGAVRIYANLRLLDHDIDDVNDSGVISMMARYEALVTRNLASRTRSQVRQAVNRAIALLTPLAEDHRQATARDEREVTFFDQGNGMTVMQALMTSLDAARVKNVLEHCARNDETLSGTMPQRMSDALVGLLTGESEVTPERRMSAAQINVVVSVETLLGLGQDSAGVIGSDFVLTATAVRQLAENSHLRRMIVDQSTGTVLELGRRSYEPSRAIKDFVKLRDQKCRAPGCVRNAMKCDVDHIQAWDDGGETNVDNLASLCRRHHILKTIGTWQYELKPNGDTEWRLPDGHIVVDYFQPWNQLAC